MQIDANLTHYNELEVTGGSGVTLKEAEDAFAALLSREGLKVMVTPS